MRPAGLVLPALRWRDESGFDHEAPTIERGLELGVGGFIVFGGTSEAVRELTSVVGRRAGRPLVFGADLERGPGQQVAGLTELPPPAALASLGSAEPVRRAGAITAAEARSVGIGWVYGPDADLDLEAGNPIVQTRSFGRDPGEVSALVTAWVEGCQGAGAAACAKHFPGHGRTRIDSHDRMPVVDTPREELLATDLAPFRAAVQSGVASVMTAHVSFPALDPAGRPATLSAVILGLLRRELGFDGAIVSDAMMMGALREGRTPGEAGLEALRAGVDLLLYPEDPWATIGAIETAAAREPAVARRVRDALGRRDRVLAWASGAAAPVDLAANGRFAAELADRLIRPSPHPIALRAPIELVLVDDDRCGAYPPSPAHHVAETLRGLAVPLGQGGSKVVLAFAEPRASKGRAGFGPESRAALEADGAGAALIALFAHGRLAAELPAGVPWLHAWHRQRLMQDAVARWIAGRLG